ncbi:MAG: hypothetical protein JO202_08015 [Ktedonobacteraceae bacterium]|nr:hypothetical protein [Ktedonobacteraceae bacterium]
MIVVYLVYYNHRKHILHLKRFNDIGSGSDQPRFEALNNSIAKSSITITNVFMLLPSRGIIQLTAESA